MSCTLNVDRLCLGVSSLCCFGADLLECAAVLMMGRVFHWSVQKKRYHLLRLHQIIVCGNRRTSRHLGHAHLGESMPSTPPGLPSGQPDTL